MKKVENLRKLRIERNMSQDELGKAVQISGSSISNYELGGNYPEIAVLRRMAKYFNVSTDYLLDLTDVPYPLPDAKKYLLDEKQAEVLHDIFSIPPDERQPLIDLAHNYCKRIKR